MKLVNTLCISTFICLWSSQATAAPVYCKQIGSLNAPVFLYDNNCPVGMMQVGSAPTENQVIGGASISSSSSRSKSGCRGVMCRIQNGESTGLLGNLQQSNHNQAAQNFANSVNNLMAPAKSQSSLTSTQKKLDTISLIEDLYKQGTISKQQAEKLKAEAINN